MDNISKEEYSNILKEQTELLLSGARAIESLLDNLYHYFADFTKYSKLKNEEEQNLIKEFNYFNYELEDYMDQIHIEIPALIDVVKESENQLSKLQKTIDELGRELEDQKKQTNEMKEKLEEQKKIISEMNDKNKKQSELIKELKKKCEHSKDEYSMNLSYSAAMGSVLAKMLWKTSKSQEAIETYIETETMNQFLNLANNTIKAFKDSYPTEIPHAETYEFNFIISLLGISINIIAQKSGREYVLERDIGTKYIRNIVSYLGDIPVKSGRLLKRLIVMLLYNLTFSKQGTLLIQDCENSIDNIMNCFSKHHTAEIQSIAVSLMNLLLLSSPESKEFCLKVTKKLSQNENDFIRMMDDADTKTKEICSQFINKLRAINEDI